MRMICIVFIVLGIVGLEININRLIIVYSLEIAKNKYNITEDK